jgi:diphosphomevalonate decarboxylase
MKPGARVWKAAACSNIALIKYMGKTDTTSNRPANSSLSLALPHLQTYVTLELDPALNADRFSPLLEIDGRKVEPIELSEKGVSRFLAHLGKIKEHFGFKGAFHVSSANDFPSDCGLASSASSFAALTKVAMTALAELTGSPQPTSLEMAKFSQRGSGSSCRSFFAPWSMWSAETVGDVRELVGKSDFIHQAVVVEDAVKTVSSSEAHVRVTSSLLFEGRTVRAETRLKQLVAALASDRWSEAFEITWAEFWDMHALFHTSHPSFSYMTAGSLEVLDYARKVWQDLGDGPLVTMDAGANVHLIYRNTPLGLKASEKVRERFEGDYVVFGSHTLHGAPS